MQIAVISGKGGTGKSSISAAFATIQKNIVLADCDVDAANLYLLFNPVCEEEQPFVSGQKAVIDEASCINCGTCINYCRFGAIVEKDGQIVINETACDGCRLCTHVCPAQAISMINEDDSRMYAGTFRNGKMVYGRLAPGEENSGRLVSLVREKAKELAQKNNLDTIIIDGPPGIGCSALSSITGVDYVVIVTEPTKSGLHDLKRVLTIVSNFHLKAGVIINKADLNASMSDEIEDYCTKQQIKVLAQVPFNPQVVEAMTECKSIIEYAPGSETSRVLREVYQEIIKKRT